MPMAKLYQEDYEDKHYCQVRQGSIEIEIVVAWMLRISV